MAMGCPAPAGAKQRDSRVHKSDCRHSKLSARMGALVAPCAEVPREGEQLHVEFWKQRTGAAEPL
jgi:hypothetical protein